MDNVRIVEQGQCGELVLRGDGANFEVIANGTFLMDTRDGTSERLLVTSAAQRMAGKARMLIGGLGVGFSLRAALDHPAIGDVVVVEREAAVIEWNHGPLAEVNGNAVADAEIVCADLLDYLRTTEPFDAICLDIDNGPQWTVDPGNSLLYNDSGTALLRSKVTEVLSVWSAAAHQPYESLLREHFADVTVLESPVARGEPDVVYLASVES